MGVIFVVTNLIGGFASLFGGAATGSGFGLGYGGTLPVGYSLGSAIVWKQMAQTNVKKYMYEEMLKAYVDFYVARTKYGLGLAQHGLSYY